MKNPPKDFQLGIGYLPDDFKWGQLINSWELETFPIPLEIVITEPRIVAPNNYARS